MISDSLALALAPIIRANVLKSAFCDMLKVKFSPLSFHCILLARFLFVARLMLLTNVLDITSHLAFIHLQSLVL